MGKIRKAKHGSPSKIQFSQNATIKFPFDDFSIFLREVRGSIEAHFR